MTGNEFIQEIIKVKEVIAQKGPPQHSVKRIINGVTYNASTSACIETWQTPKDIDNEEWYRGTETLYQTRTGHYFLIVYSHSGGHPGGFPVGLRTVCGHSVVPLTINEALQWIKIRDLPNKISKNTGENISENGPNSIVVRLSPHLTKKLTEEAKLAGLSRNDLIVQNLENISVRKPRMSLTSYRDSWDYYRIDPDAVELSRQQAAGLVLRGAAAVAEAVAIAETDDGEWRYMLPEHRRAIIFAITGDETARAKLISPQARVVYTQARESARVSSSADPINPYRDSDPELEAAVDVGWADGRADAAAS